MKCSKFTIGLLLLIPAVCLAEDYRVDTQKKFDEISTIELLPGDTISLKRGMTFTGMLAPQGNGSEDAPVRIGAYGGGNRPVIHAKGSHLAGVMLKNPSYWEVNSLEVTNTDGSDQDQGNLFGIYVLVERVEGTYRHVYINDCYVHNVNGMVAGKGRGGIHVHMKKVNNSKFDDLRITNNWVENIGGVGIGNNSTCAEVNLLKDGYEAINLWTRVYVAGNRVDSTGRNNVIARASKDAIYEHNILANSSRRDTGHSIFCFNTDGIKIQYNEAYGNVGDTDNKDGGGESDRGGFDADYNCINTYIQYNYSHDNLWFCGIMKKPTRNVVIRYNISQNDKHGIYFYGSDNGGRTNIPGFESDNLNLPLRGGKGNMYEGGIRVPFIVSGPHIQAGSISHVPVSGVDLLPTITDLAGQQLQHDKLDGGSLKSLLHGQSETVKRNNDFLIFHQAVIRKPQSAILQGDYKLVKWLALRLSLMEWVA